MRRLSCTVAMLMLPYLCGQAAQTTQEAAAPIPPANAEIRKMLAERVDALGEGVGIVVAVVGPEGRRVIAYGRRSQGDPRPLDGDTAFEIGSVTKVFTSLLLADMVMRREVALADPVAKHLPDGTRIPHRNDRSITLVDLATHTSGLPFMPEDALAADDGGRHSIAQFYRFLARHELQREIGVQREYSNIGYWLLSEALASRGGMDYEPLLRERILLPLGMTHTAITLSSELKAQLAVGHDATLQPSPYFSDIPIYSLMPAAGGLISSANDMARFLEMAMGYERSPLAPALALTLSTRRPTPGAAVEQALAWTVEGQDDDTLIFHDGGTWGYASAVAWDPRQRLGVVVLSNHVASVADLARHLLRPSIPLERPTATRRTEIALDPAVLDTYSGRYEAPGEGIFVIARESGYLTIQSPPGWGLPKLRLRAESARDFFAAELPLRVTFQTDGEGYVDGLLIYPPRGQKGVPASRMANEM